MGIADSTFRGAATRALEKQKLADEIEALKIDPSWRPHEVLRYVAKLVRES